jgi:hypothetical protein
MVIKIKYLTIMDEKGIEQEKFFEVDEIPSKAQIFRTLNDMGSNVEESSLAIERHAGDAASMRANGVVVPRIYRAD